MFGCKHKFGKVEGQYQYCEKCGVARTVPHEHRWEIINKFQRTNRFTKPGDFVDMTYVLRCSICGKIKKEVID